MNRRSVLLGAALGAVAPIVTGAAARAEGATPRPSTGTQRTSGTRPVKAAPPNAAARLKTLPAKTSQVIIVHGSGYAPTKVTLETYAKVRGRWLPISAPLPARIGSLGFSDNHVEGKPNTPTGVYSIGATMYGIAASPGVRYPYHRLVSNDWWNENSNSARYNSFQHSTTNPGGPSEALWKVKPAYTHFAVITYNMAPNVAAPKPHKGSGIFLHQFSTSGGPTAGCVSLAHDHLVGVLRWLDPAQSPRIVLSPTQNLSRY
jgi:L,D-peptidoglycan transpeptidase YkuD (ErfK/YbiS/YcfS/YnhG family)